MKKVEDQLMKMKEVFDNIETPENMEQRLRNTLNNHQMPKKKKRNWRATAAAALIALLLVGYNIDTLAYYGKKLLGYEDIMNNTLKELNESGKGQVIDKSYRFENGVTVTLDAIMLDDNQLLAFYTIEDPSGQIDDIGTLSSISMQGSISRYYERSGQGKENDNKTRIKWITSFEPPLVFEKTLTFEFSLNQKENKEVGQIIFQLDRDRAMGHRLKSSIDKKIDADGHNIHFDTIIASPTTTVIKGRIRTILGLAKDIFKGERVRPNHLDVKLLANGKEVQWQGSGLTTDVKGITFDLEYDALPTPLHSLQLELVSFDADHDVKKQVDLIKGETTKEIEIHGQEITINSVYESSGDTYMTITTDEDTVLTRVHLMIDGNIVELEDTASDKHEKLSDGTILHTRTLHFTGTGKKMKLNVEKMRYTKDYHKIIDMPID